MLYSWYAITGQPQIEFVFIIIASTLQNFLLEIRIFLLETLVLSFAVSGVAQLRIDIGILLLESLVLLLESLVRLFELFILILPSRQCLGKLGTQAFVVSLVASHGTDILVVAGQGVVIVGIIFIEILLKVSKTKNLRFHSVVGEGPTHRTSILMHRLGLDFPR